MNDEEMKNFYCNESIEGDIVTSDYYAKTDNEKIYAGCQVYDKRKQVEKFHDYTDINFKFKLCKYIETGDYSDAEDFMNFVLSGLNSKKKQQEVYDKLEKYFKSQLDKVRETDFKR